MLLRDLETQSMAKEIQLSVLAHIAIVGVVCALQMAFTCFLQIQNCDPFCQRYLADSSFKILVCWHIFLVVNFTSVFWCICIHYLKNWLGVYQIQSGRQGSPIPVQAFQDVLESGSLIPFPYVKYNFFWYLFSDSNKFSISLYLMKLETKMLFLYRSCSLLKVTCLALLNCL